MANPYTRSMAEFVAGLQYAAIPAEVRERATQAILAIRSVPGPGFLYPEANVFDIAFSKDGQSMAVGGADGAVRVYDAKTNALRHTLNGHTATVYGVVFSLAHLMTSISNQYKTSSLTEA